MTQPRLLMIVPTRGRPDSAAAFIDAWRATTGPEARLVFAVDDDDPEVGAYRAVGRAYEQPVYVGPRLRLGGTLNAVAGWNNSLYEAIGFAGDDHRMRSPGWALRFLDELDRLGTGMVYGNDLIQGPNLPTAIAMTSNIITALGYMVPGGLEHLYVDNAWLALGRAIGRITYLPDVVLEHMHPIAGKAVEDAGYRLNNAEAQYEADGRRFEDWLQFQMPADVERLQAMIRGKEAGHGVAAV